MKVTRICVSFILLFLTLSFLPPKIFAQSSNPIIVTGFSPNRSNPALLSTAGDPYQNPGGTNVWTTRVGNFLLNSSNFGQEGVVQCEVDFIPPFDYISKGSLVSNNEDLLVDVFFATNTAQDLSAEEKDELVRFLELGGIIYSSTTSTGGDQHVSLYSQLGLDTVFGLRQQVQTGAHTSFPNQDSPVINGPFGTVGPLDHGPYREVITNDLVNIANNPALATTILAESRIGKGYLISAGTSLYVNILASSTENQKYFGNLVALGCDDSWRDNSVVLDVPSFKQGLYPLNDNSPTDPTWEGEIYDSGYDQELDCDLDTPGVADGTIGECGCALSSIAMVMRYHGINNGLIGIDIDPYTLNAMFQFFVDKENPLLRYGYSDGNVRWIGASNVSATAHDNYPEQPKLEYTRENYSYDRVVELIDSGIAIILKVNGGSHWVVVTGYNPDTQRLIINDPAFPDPPVGERTFLDTRYTPDSVNSMVVYTPTFSDFRYIQLIADGDYLELLDSEGKPFANTQYIFEESYVNPALSNGKPAGGIHTWTLKLPSDGEYTINSRGPFTIYTSDVEGSLAGKVVEQDENEKTYKFTYAEATAGERIDIEEVVEEPEPEQMKIDIRPWTDFNWINPKGLIPVPVAILSSRTFDATKVKEKSIRFGVNGTEKSLVDCLNFGVDANSDGIKDMICFVNERKLNAKKHTTQMTLTAEGFQASDSVTVLNLHGIFSLF